MTLKQAIARNRYRQALLRLGGDTMRAARLLLYDGMPPDEFDAINARLHRAIAALSVARIDAERVKP